MPKPKPKKYALIWWLDSAYKDVIDLLVLPRSSREVNSIASVKWRDNKRKTTTKARAKVLAISGKYVFHKIIVIACIVKIVIGGYLRLYQGRLISFIIIPIMHFRVANFRY